MKNYILIILLSAPLLSACSVVGTAVDIVTIPVDLLTMHEGDGDIVVAQTAPINESKLGYNEE